MAQSAQIALLSGIFGVTRIAHEISRQRVDVVEMRQCGVVKTTRPCLFGNPVICYRIVLDRPRFS
jgi:hypothetical protein